MRAFIGLAIAVCIAIAIGVVSVWAAGPSTYGPSVARFSASFPGQVETRVSSRAVIAQTLPRHLTTRFTQYDYSASGLGDQLKVEISVMRLLLPPNTHPKVLEGNGGGLINTGSGSASAPGDGPITMRSTKVDGYTAQIGVGCIPATDPGPRCSGSLLIPFDRLTGTPVFASWFVAVHAPSEDVLLELLQSFRPG